MEESCVRIVSGQEPLGWERKIFFSNEDNGVAVITITKESVYRPTKEKENDIRLRMPETFKTLPFERYLFLSCDFGTAGIVQRTMMLSQYLRAIRAAGLKVYGEDGETLLHGYTALITEGDVSFLAPSVEPLD